LSSITIFRCEPVLSNGYDDTNAEAYKDCRSGNVANSICLAFTGSRDTELDEDTPSQKDACSP
jgi:hypothetical protein